MEERDGSLGLFLCGDVMTGRGVDQVLPHPSDPALHERHVESASRYVELAEAASGPIPAPVDPSYPWGDALDELERAAPHLRIVNLETAVTTSDEPWTGKGIHYRMHPRNVPCLTAAGVDACVLANNRVLDWGRAGLRETLEALHAAGLQTAGAGVDRGEAERPLLLEDGGRRVRLHAYASPTAGVPESWAATEGRPGLALLPDLSPATARRTAERTRASGSEDDLVVASIHWGGNWGYRVPRRQREFAHLLVEEGGVDVVHGHSSHHPKGLEVHRGRPILYGCGDLLNDYEGIGGHERFRPRLALMHFVSLDRRDGRLTGLEMVPMEVRRMSLRRAGASDARWLQETLDRESRALGARVRLREDGRLVAGEDAG